MRRYLRNRTKSDCGPVAVLNIFKWAGFPVTYEKHAAYIKKVAGYVYEEDYQGCDLSGLLKAVNVLGRGKIRGRTYQIDDLEVLKKHIKKGNAFILRHGVSPITDEYKCYHYTVVVPGKGDKFTWLNMGPGTKMEVHPKEFERRVFSTRRFDDDPPQAIMIRKTG